jgi:uncharacterized ParB-like nuclease family protein
MRKSFNYWAKLATKQTETLDIHKGVLSRFPISIMEANDANLLLDNIFTKLVIPDDGQTYYYVVDGNHRYHAMKEM